MLIDALMNLAVLAGAWCLYAVFGFLIFRRVLQEQAPMVRVNLYPLLGWATLVPISYALRMIALPFAITGPICLGLLLVCLLVWNRDLFKAPFSRPPLALLMVAIAIGSTLVLYAPKHLVFKDLRDVGDWGFDQRNYVYTTAGLLDEGLLGAAQVEGPLKWFTPYWAYVGDSIHQIATKKGRLDWEYVELQTRLGISGSGSRWFAAFPRRGFSSLDTVAASVFRLDPQQAYTLSIWMHHVLLVNLGLLAAAFFGFRWPGYVIALLVSVYWPSVSLPILADNRDQANSIIVIFTMVLALRFLPHSRPISMACLLALIAGYPELFLPGLVIFFAISLDREGSRLRSLRQAGADLGWSLLVFSPLFIPQLMGILRQWNSDGENFKLDFPIHYYFSGAILDFPIGWSLIWKELPLILPVRLAVDGLILLLILIGMAVEFRRRRFGLSAVFIALMLLGAYFVSKPSVYTAYKIASAMWPLTYVLTFTGLANVADFLNQVRRPRPAWLGFAGYAATALLFLAAIPPLLHKSAIDLPGFFVYDGVNIHLQNRDPDNLSYWPPRSRVHDPIVLEQIHRETRAKGESVLLLGANTYRTPYDYGFGQMFFRKDGAFVLNPKHSGWAVAYPSFRQLKNTDTVQRVLLICTQHTLFNYLPNAHVFLTRGEAPEWRRHNLFSDLRLGPGQGGILVTPRYKTDEQVAVLRHPHLRKHEGLLPMPILHEQCEFWVTSLNLGPDAENELEFVFESPQALPADFRVTMASDRRRDDPPAPEIPIQREGNRFSCRVKLQRGSLEETLEFNFAPFVTGMTLAEVRWVNGDTPAPAGN